MADPEGIKICASSSSLSAAEDETMVTQLSEELVTTPTKMIKAASDKELDCCSPIPEDSSMLSNSACLCARKNDGTSEEEVQFHDESNVAVHPDYSVHSNSASSDSHLPDINPRKTFSSSGKLDAPGAIGSAVYAAFTTSTTPISQPNPPENLVGSSSKGEGDEHQSEKRLIGTRPLHEANAEDEETMPQNQLENRQDERPHTVLKLVEPYDTECPELSGSCDEDEECDVEQQDVVNLRTENQAEKSKSVQEEILAKPSEEERQNCDRGMGLEQPDESQAEASSSEAHSPCVPLHPQSTQETAPAPNDSELSFDRASLNGEESTGQSKLEPESLVAAGDIDIPQESSSTSEETAGNSKMGTKSAESMGLRSHQRPPDNDSVKAISESATGHPESPPGPAEKRQLGFVTFEPFIPIDSVASEDKAAESLVAVQDLPPLYDILVDPRYKSRSPCSTAGDLPTPINDLQDADVDRDDPIASNAPVSPSTGPETSVGPSESFKLQKEPNGDSELILDQTLYISAIDSTVLLSVTCTTEDLPSLATCTLKQQIQDPSKDAVESIADDAPGDMMTDESKIATEGSLILTMCPGLNLTSEHQKEEYRIDAQGDLITIEPRNTIEYSLVLNKVCDLNVESDGRQEEESFEVTPLFTHMIDHAGPDNKEGVAPDEASHSGVSLTSYYFSEGTHESIELVAASSVCSQQHAAEKASTDLNSRQNMQTTTTAGNDQPEFLKGSPKTRHGLHQDIPPLNVFKGVTGIMSTAERLALRSSSPVILRPSHSVWSPPKMEDKTPIARIRNSQDEATVGFSVYPDGTLIGRQQDPSLLGGIKKSNSIRSEDKPKPRVSFAAIHKGPHRGSHCCRESLPIHRKDAWQYPEGERRASRSTHAPRRAAFAAYLKSRMINYDEDEDEDGDDEEDNDDDDDESFFKLRDEDEPNHAQCHGGIPRILDPRVMCTSVESSFSTFVSKADPGDEADALFAAIDVLIGHNKSAEDDASYSSYGESEYSFCEEDTKSTGLLSSLFNDRDSTKKAPRSLSNPLHNWCKEIKLPSVPVLHLEGFLKIATDFRRAGTKRKVTHRPHNSDQEALSEFVDELENQSPRDDEQTTFYEEEESQGVILPKPDVVRPKSRLSRDAESEQSICSEAQSECGVITIEDIHEIALMAAAAIEESAKNVKSNGTVTLWQIHTDDPDLSADSTEAAWDQVEHTVTDLKSVTGQSFEEKPKAHERIAAKLEHIKKTQPLVYKVFLAKMAAAEKAGKKIELRRDSMILSEPESQNHMNDNSRSSLEVSHSTTEPLSHTSPLRKQMVSIRQELSVHTINMSAKPPDMSVKNPGKNGTKNLEETSTGPLDWESFDDSPFKALEARTQSFLSACDVTDRDVPDRRDESSVTSLFDDMKWLNSAKESLSSTMETLIDAKEKLAGPLKAKLEQYSKTHPNFYRIILDTINERDQGATKTNPTHNTPSSCPLSQVSTHREDASRHNLDSVPEPSSNHEEEVTETDVILHEESRNSTTNLATCHQNTRSQSGDTNASKEIASASASTGKLDGFILRPIHQGLKCPLEGSGEVWHKQPVGSQPVPRASEQDNPAVQKSGQQPVAGVSLSKEAANHIEPEKGSKSNEKHEVNGNTHVLSDHSHGFVNKLELWEMCVSPPVQQLSFCSDESESISPTTTDDAPFKSVDIMEHKLSKVKSMPLNQDSMVADEELHSRVAAAPIRASHAFCTDRSKNECERIRVSLTTADNGSFKMVDQREQKLNEVKSLPLTHDSDATDNELHSRVATACIQASHAFCTDRSKNESEKISLTTAENGSFKMVDQREHKLTEVKSLPLPHVLKTADKELHSRVAIAHIRAPHAFCADRSKTPPLSNRTGQSHHVAQKRRSDRSNTPRASNRSEAKDTRPQLVRDIMPAKWPQSCTKDDDVGSCTQANSASTSSDWETFEGSTFKDFVVQSLGGSTPSNGSQKHAAKSSTPEINLQTTFLDSILPAPPSFPSNSEFHSQQRDPWDFSEAAGEQWEHFSPLSFDGNFTNWGMKKHSVSRASKSRQQPHVRQSPSSIAEF